MRNILILAALVSATSATAASPDSCAGYVGQTIGLNEFDAVAKVLRQFPNQKGEYETTAQFDARVANAQSLIPETLIIPSIFSPEYVSYDADARALKVQSYALKNLNADFGTVFGYGTPYEGKIRQTPYNNIDVVVSKQETKTGTYLASNAYGAQVTVSQITRIEKAIFESKNEKGGEGPFPETGQDQVIGSIPMDVPDARAIKESGKVAFVVAPRWPYYVEGTKHWQPNITSRIDVTNPLQVIVGDIQCALLLTGNNRVAAAFPTL